MDPRLRKPLDYERGFWSRGVRRVAGVDEAGRGPLAGPVVAAAVVLPPDLPDALDGVTDSKALAPADRERLHRTVTEVALAVGLGAASVREIDRTDILRASTRAMARALAALGVDPDHVVVDGLPVRGLGRPHRAVVGGDLHVHSISCASIVAKVVRDRLMRRLACRYPVYGWERNAGYGTPEHMEALAEHGPSPHHRLTFTGLQYDLGL